MDALQSTLEAALSKAFNERVALQSGASARRYGTSRYETSHGPIFIKVGPESAYDMFDAEADGLRVLAQAQAIRTPRVFACECCEDGAFIALEWLELRAATRASEAHLGEQLARQHRVTHAQFGWDRDNTIGPTPQLNARSHNWIEFFRDQRLHYQLELAIRSGADRRVRERGERLCEALPAFFTHYRPVASLLHGDLWGGNWGADEQGRPVIFDPAVYFGDREADLAMTRLFGGFGTAFYAAYEAAWPPDAGAKARTTLYNLYHVLNHFNLFGGDYLTQARTMIDALLAQVKS